MTSIQKAQLELLEETIEFYKHHDRCVTNLGLCKYHIDGKEGCAIGRLITDVDLRKKLDLAPVCSVDSHAIFEMLPKEIQEYGKTFLASLQYLHDFEYHWDGRKITDEGLMFIDQIKKIHGLN
jgi:hypothetical protein